MDNPRADKVAVVNEVRDRLEASDAAVLTEYRGLSVSELAELRQGLSAAGGDYKIYKNTLVRLAIADSPQAPMHDFLTGPTAIAFVRGDVSAVAKTLRDFARGNPNLIVKGGMVGTGVLSANDIGVLADLPSRDTLLAQFAGALAAPIQQLASLIEALPRNLAYGLSALIDQRQASGEVLETGPAPAADAAATDAAATEAPAQPRHRPPRHRPPSTTAEAPTAEAPTAETPGDRVGPGTAAADPVQYHNRDNRPNPRPGNKELRQWQAP